MPMSRIEKASFEEAQRLGHDWAGPEHGLLGVLRGDPDDVARRALEEAGLDAAMVESLLGRKNTPTREKRPGVRTNPAWHKAFGRAEGFAACLGDGGVEPVHLVLAFLWDDTLWQFADLNGVRREAVLDGLRRAGVPLPAAPMPELQAPINVPPGGPPTACQFCGGPMLEGRRFVVPAPDRSCTVYFCSPSCSLGFGVAAVVAGGRVREAGQPTLADQFGTAGSWYEPN